MLEETSEAYSSFGQCAGNNWTGGKWKQNDSLDAERKPPLRIGMITKSDEKSLSGLPAFATVAGLGALTSQRSKQEEDDELLILITPYVVEFCGQFLP
jgi:hypothetical protein